MKERKLQMLREKKMRKIKRKTRERRKNKGVKSKKELSKKNVEKKEVFMHHIDFTLGATLPNRAAYRKNPEGSKEIQQVGKLVEKGWVRENMNAREILVILVPKKDES
ncbi:hypothetical protein CR513_29002, partial [Mucuna pruriens]